MGSLSLPSFSSITGSSRKNLAPNGAVSKLPDRLYHFVRTPMFKSFFGDWEKDPKNASKIVDENGEPLLVRHQSQSDKPFSIFSESKKRSGIRNSVSRENKDRYGVYFTSLPSNELREMFDKTGTGIQYEGFVSIVNPLILPNTHYFDFDKNKPTELTIEVYKRNNYFDVKDITKRDKDKLHNLGYDGVWGNVNEGFYRGIDEIVIFDGLKFLNAPK